MPGRTAPNAYPKPLRSNRPLFFLAAWCFIPAFVLGAVIASPDTPAPDPELEKLIRSLGDTDYVVREDATNALLKRKDATEALKMALKSSDREVARRSRLILEAFAAPPSDDSMDRLKAFLKDKKLDMAVEYLVHRPVWGEDGKRLNPLTMHLLDIANEAATKFGDKQFPAPQGSQPLGVFDRWERALNPQFYSEAKPAVIQPGLRTLTAVSVCGRELSIKGDFPDSLFLATHSIRGSKGFNGCVFYCGGPVEFDDEIIHSVVICDGSFRAKGAHGCLIIASGAVRIESVAGNCRIVTASKVEFAGQPLMPGTQVKAETKTLLGLTKFFDPADEGLVLRAGEGRATVQELAKDKRFAKTNLKPGDVITGIDDTAAESGDQFRRLLRARVAVLGTAFTLNVLRDGKKIDIPVQ